MVDLPPGFRVVPQGAAPAKPIAVPEGFRVVQPQSASQPIEGAEKSVMPNLTHIPILGPVLGLAGYDGRAVPENASMVPALDPINAAGSKLAESIPIVGPKLAEFGNNVDAAFASAVEGKPVTPQDRAAINSQEQENFPVASGVGQAAGIVLPLAAAGATQLGAKALGQAGTVGQRALFGGLSGSAISGADTLARGGSAEDVRNSALIGGVAGGAIPIAAKGAEMAWGGIKSALSGAAGGVDDLASAELKGSARAMFDQVDNSGVRIDPASYDRFVSDVQAALTAKRVNPILSPKADAVLSELKAVGDEIAAAGEGISLGQMHDLRQIAQSAAQGVEGRDQVLGGIIIEKLDDFLDTLKPSDIAGSIDDANRAVGALQDAIGTWHAARKTSTIEEAIYRAQNSASGLENGLRVQFRRILNNPKARQGFTADEISAIEEVANGSVGSNLMRLAGKFGFGGGGASNMLGGTIGTVGATAAGGPLLGLATGLGASGARAGAEKMTANAAKGVLQQVSGVGPSGPQSFNALRAIAAANNAPVNLPFSPALAGQALSANLPR